jgi:hypothetical protein
MSLMKLRAVQQTKVEESSPCREIVSEWFTVVYYALSGFEFNNKSGNGNI